MGEIVCGGDFKEDYVGCVSEMLWYVDGVVVIYDLVFVFDCFIM